MDPTPLIGLHQSMPGDGPLSQFQVIQNEVVTGWTMTTSTRYLESPASRRSFMGWFWFFNYTVGLVSDVVPPDLVSRPRDPFNQLWVAIPLNLPHKIVQMLECVPETCPISSEVEIFTFLVCFPSF